MRDEGLYLDDIVEAVDHIQQFVSGLSREDFLASELIKSAVLQKLSIIGESSSKISTKIKVQYPQIDWAAMKGLRNIAVHAYFDINWQTVWDTRMTWVL